ncbi:MAG: AtpZ/AtpI family protein [Acidimicrobiales bacterium]|nr:AtpZ/AtpI family protein [Acidimicrobiales bacterium]
MDKSESENFSEGGQSPQNEVDSSLPTKGELESPASNSENSNGPSLWLLAGVGSELVGGTVGGMVLGIWVDSVLKSYPKATFLGLLGGIVAAVAVAWAQIRKFL